ncbi:MAG: hypothetical protein HUU46_02425 [Candidatus Hydrogenedentes bacterium]|nr:hypothetical protein [Candidatus Hydrogenedentota bacterium]
MLDLDFIFNLLLTAAGLDLEGSLASFYDSFAYSILLWVLNLGGII